MVGLQIDEWSEFQHKWHCVNSFITINFLYVKIKRDAYNKITEISENLSGDIDSFHP